MKDMQFLIFLFSSLFLSQKLMGAPSALPQLMSEEKVARYRTLIPKTSNEQLNQLLQSARAIFYDATSIIPGYQDSLGDPRGFRPNTIDRSFINLAVPGGWERLFAKKGMFNFPFGTGGVDRSDNVVKINVWIPPTDSKQQFLPVALWRASFSRFHWVFPVGTQIGEILMIQFTDGALRVFEIRIKTRTLAGWINDVYRPFLTPSQLISGIESAVPNWNQEPQLQKLLAQLKASNSLSAYPMKSQYFSNTFSAPEGALDVLPDFNNKSLVKQLLSTHIFELANQQIWKENAGKAVYTPSTLASDSIVPRNYEAGVFPTNDQSCNRCHEHAGRQIGDFQSALLAYGELWGEDQIFSWHPFETQAFLKPDGSIKNFNDDNRRIRKDFLDSGLVEYLAPAEQPNTIYKPIPHDWKYTPF